MYGTVIDYHPQNGKGHIMGEDGVTYRFELAQLKRAELKIGDRVEFDSGMHGQHPKAQNAKVVAQ